MTRLAKNKENFSCRFCKKSFKKEKTLASHMCPKKQRFSEKDNLSSRLGFRVFQRFYELTTRAKKPKSFEDFINSSLYIEFIKFGRYLGQRDAININEFVDFVIQNGFKLRDWKKDTVYETYLQNLMKKEPVEKALERTFVTMNAWAEKNECKFSDFFNKITTNEATHIIRSGRISPWVLYLSESASNLLSKLSSEQGRIISSIIDKDIWKARVMSRKEDAKFVMSVLEEAGI